MFNVNANSTCILLSLLLSNIIYIELDWVCAKDDAEWIDVVVAAAAAAAAVGTAWSSFGNKSLERRKVASGANAAFIR